MIDRAIIDRSTRRLIVPSVFGCHDLSYARSQDATSGHTIGRRMPRLLVRSVAGDNDRLIVPSVAGRHDFLYDGSCHRYSPIVRNSATTRRDRSRYPTATRDRSKRCRSVAHWPNRNQSYDPEIVRSGVTVALLCVGTCFPFYAMWQHYIVIA